MIVVAFTLLVTALTAFALWYAQRGNERKVDGAGNAFDAYYGKGRFQPPKTPPCEKCSQRGCIGAGECRCGCHRGTAKAA